MLEEKVHNNEEKLEDFENQVKLIHNQLYVFIYSFVGEKELAKDALQNTLLAAYNNYFSLKDKAKFKSWIFTIAKRETMRLSITSKKYVPSEINDFNVISMSSNLEPLPEDSVLNDELKEKVKDAINSLKKDLKEIIILKYYHDISFEHIAKMNNINVNTVRTRHLRAKQSINQYLLNHYY